MKPCASNTIIRIALTLILGLISITSYAEETQPMWIDVRTASEYNDGHVDGALNIEFGDIVNGVSKRDVDTDTPIIVYCGSGKRSGMARDSLLKAGYSDVTNAGGLAQAQALKASQ